MPRGAFSSNGAFPSMSSMSPNGAQPSTGGMQEKIPSGYRKFAVENFTPEQMGLFQQLFSHLGPDSYLSKLAGGDQSTFDQMEAPALRQFNELQGGLASRFSGMGMGGRNSSGFQNASNAAAKDFAGQLQANRQGLQRQALMDLMNMSSSMMNQSPYETGLVEKRQKQPSFLQGMGMNFANSYAKNLGKTLGGGGEGLNPSQIAAMLA
jgi:hypothetical protein